MKQLIVRGLGLLFVLFGISLFFIDDIKGYFMEGSNTKVEECYLEGDCSEVSYSNIESRALTQGIENSDDSLAEDNTEVEESKEEEELESVGQSPTSESFSELVKNTPVDQDLVGMFYADKIGLVEPLYLGASHLNLARGLGLVGTTNLDSSNIPIAGHRVEGVGIRFNEITQLEVGDSVTIKKNNKGVVEEVEYMITEGFSVSPTDVSVLSQDTGNDKQELTLITCDDYNPNTGIWETRYILKAEEV